METRLIIIGAVLALVLASTAGPLLATSPASAATSPACNEQVTHDAFRSQAAIDAVNEIGSATSTVRNTRVRLQEATGFVRVHANNPNGYCVAYTVEISQEIVSPADLGEIESNDEATAASWRAAQNLSSGSVYTRIEFTLGPGANATFAPSTVRVHSLSWTGAARSEGNSAITYVRSLWGSPELEQRTYTIAPSGDASRITVPLEDGNGSRIEEWQATYELNGDTHPIEQDAAAPVYYSESETSVTFHFSDAAVQEGATVEFTAEPNIAERTQHSASAYFSGITDGIQWFPVGTTAVVIA